MKILIPALLLSTLPIQSTSHQHMQPQTYSQSRSQSHTNQENEIAKDEAVVGSLLRLANDYVKQQQFDEALVLHQAAVLILSRTYGPENPRMCKMSYWRAELLRNAGRTKEAEQVKRCENKLMW